MDGNGERFATEAAVALKLMIEHALEAKTSYSSRA